MMLDNKDIGNKIKNVRSEKQLTQDDIANAIGVATSTITRYEKGQVKRIKLPVIQAISRYLGVNPAWVIGKSNEKYNNEITNIIPIDNDTKFVNIPVVGRVAAGVTCYADMDIIDYEPTSVDSITPGEDYVYLKVVGDSMYPEFKEGDLILIRCQTSVDSGSYAVVIIDGEDGVVKKIVYGQNWIELHSINPMYPVRRFENEDVLRIRVFGLVKEIKRKF